MCYSWRTGPGSYPGRKPLCRFTRPGTRSARRSKSSCSGGLAHRKLGPIAAIGVDEIQYSKGHKYLTLVYQIDAQCTRLLWIGKERTVATFERFFDMIGTDLAGKIEFVCSDIWRPYLRVIRERCSNALNILDRFHIVAKINEALDDVRAAEARKLVQDGFEPVHFFTKLLWLTVDG
ncbi:transposase [Undibacterium arcticum]